MNTDVINYAIAAALALTACGIYLAVIAYEKRVARKQVAAVFEDEHDVGPDALRLMEDLDDHLDAHFARLAPLFEQVGPPPANPAWQAGQQRLRDAIREQNGEAS